MILNLNFFNIFYLCLSPKMHRAAPVIWVSFILFWFFFFFLWARCKNIGRLELFVQTLYGNNRIDSLGFCIIKENWSCDQNLPKKASSNFVLLFHVSVGLLHIRCELDETRVENTITRCSKIFSISLNIYIYIYIYIYVQTNWK